MNDWIIGYIAGGGVVLVVALVLIIMIVGARRAAAKAEAILAALVEARDGTAALWSLQDTKIAAGRIVAAATAARHGLAGDGGAPL